ncbi:hypothetical protein E2C01_097059 [Portunus trituberculatus]|uniref:Uncharacterized protein n=1 Tax=Portunus trituberculatus TaxID=210409 RepID=A0A5B7K4Q4_PORTR|nr:hypothetical protein [Portunus trituberculatus]
MSDASLHHKVWIRKKWKENVAEVKCSSPGREYMFTSSGNTCVEQRPRPRMRGGVRRGGVGRLLQQVIIERSICSEMEVEDEEQSGASLGNE